MLGRTLSWSGMSVFLIVSPIIQGRKVHCAVKDAGISKIKSLQCTTQRKGDSGNQENDPVSTCTFHLSDLLFTMQRIY